MNEELKEQYERDIESGYPEPWTLWLDRRCGDEYNVCHSEPCFETGVRNPNADQIILDWQREKYAEDAEWNPDPKSLWQVWDEDDHKWRSFYASNEKPAFFRNVRYRRRPGAPTREQWEVEQKGEKMSILSRRIKKVDRCATCRHKYEPKQPTIHVSMQFPDGRTYEADLPEPMREEPNYGETFFIILIYSCTVREENWSAFAADKVHLAAGLCHRTDADAQVWLHFFKQWRNDK